MDLYPTAPTPRHVWPRPSGSDAGRVQGGRLSVAHFAAPWSDPKLNAVVFGVPLAIAALCRMAVLNSG